jgi:hypothetical protein
MIEVIAVGIPGPWGLFASGLPVVHVNVDNVPDDYARDGVDGTGITAPSGGSGVRGWLSGLYAAIGGTAAAVASDTGASTTNGFLRWLRDRFLFVAPRLTYTEDWSAALTSSYQKVTTTTTATKSLRMSCACNATAYDIEYAVVTAGGAAPTTTGQALLAGDDFLAGIPIGDIYARSATAQKLIVWRA